METRKHIYVIRQMRDVRWRKKSFSLSEIWLKTKYCGRKFEGVNQILMCELLIRPRPTMIMFGQIWMARTLLSAAV